MTMNFSRNLALLRKGKGITQEVMAEKCGVSRQAVTKWECGNSLPDLYKTSEIAEILGVTVDVLLHGIMEDKVIDVFDSDFAAKLESKIDDILAEIRKRNKNVLDEYITNGDASHEEYGIEEDIPAEAFTNEGIQAMEKGNFTDAVDYLEEGLVRGDTRAGGILLSLYKEMMDIYEFEENEYEYYQTELVYSQKLQKYGKIMEMQLQRKLRDME